MSLPLSSFCCSSCWKNEPCSDLSAGKPEIELSSSVWPSPRMRYWSAVNASSGCFEFFVIRNESAFIGTVTLPLYDGSAARFQLPPASVTQQTFQRKFSCIATLPELK